MSDEQDLSAMCVHVSGLHTGFGAGGGGGGGGGKLGKLSFLKSWGRGNAIQECIGVQRLGEWYYTVGNNAMYNSRGLRDW